MKKYGLRYAILTKLSMVRKKLVTKETVKKAYQGKMKHDKDWSYYEMSIHDNLEIYFITLQDRNRIKNEESVACFFTPKLTEKELKLFEERNEQHLSTYFEYLLYGNTNVDAEELNKSDSRSKFVKGTCYRETIILKLESNEKQTTDITNEMH